MTYSISGTGEQTQVVTGENIKGLLISLYATTVADLTVSIMQSIQVNVQLTRGGKQFQVVSGNLFALGNANNPGNMEGQTLFTNYKAFAIDWGQVINLKGQDTLSVQIVVPTAATGQVLTCTTWSSSGVGDFIPKVVVSTVDTTMSNQTHPGGDDIFMVSVVSDGLNFDITNININSREGFTQSLSTANFVALMAEAYDSNPVYFSFPAYLGSPIDGVTITTINVAQSVNTWVVVYSGFYDEKTSQVANALAVNVLKKAEEKANM